MFQMPDRLSIAHIASYIYGNMQILFVLLQIFFVQLHFLLDLLALAMPRSYNRKCNACGNYTYLGRGRCSHNDPINPCPLNNPAGRATSSGTTAHDADWRQHQSWQEEAWQEEKTSAKEKRRQWWQNRQAWKKQKHEHQANKDTGAAAPSVPAPKSPPPVPPPPMPPPKAPAPKPASKARPKPPSVPPPKAQQSQPSAGSQNPPGPKFAAKAKPSSSQAKAGQRPRGSAGQVPPWKQPDWPSDSEESWADEDIFVETPGPIIEELLPELEWIPDMTGFELEDGAVTTAEQVIPPALPAASEAAQVEIIDLIEEEIEEEDPLEEDPVITSFSAVQEAKRNLMLAQQLINQGDEPLPEPLEHATQFDPEPERELSPNAAVVEA